MNNHKVNSWGENYQLDVRHATYNEAQMQDIINNYATPLLNYPSKIYYKKKLYPNDFPSTLQQLSRSNNSNKICLEDLKLFVNSEDLFSDLGENNPFEPPPVNLEEYLKLLPDEPPQKVETLKFPPEPKYSKVPNMSGHPDLPAQPVETFQLTPEEKKKIKFKNLPWLGHIDLIFIFFEFLLVVASFQVDVSFLMVLLIVVYFHVEVKNTTYIKKTESQRYEKMQNWEIECQELSKDWEDQYFDIIERNAKLKEDYNKEVEPILEINSTINLYNEARNNYWIKHKKILMNSAEKSAENYQIDKDKHAEIQSERIALFEKYRNLINSSEEEDIAAWWTLFLQHSHLPDCLPIKQSVKIDKDAGIIVFSLNFPNLSKLEITKFKELKSGPKEVPANKAETKEALKYIFFAYPIRTAWEMANCQIGENFQKTVINSTIHRPNPSTGHPDSVCIGSIFIDLKKIQSIKIDKIEPQETYKLFKGVYSGDPEDVIDTIPVLTFKEDESRFVEGKDIAEDVKGTNLAAIDWEDFEHLIRELFEKEFANDDAEVKVTKASRDKGVDAIVMDKDPIKGGKFVVQAKRYTNTVDVSAVRDLYGTTVNEGANRGILVTTSSYGPDAYEFANNKPITLLNGKDLISLMNKHGYDCFIDIKQAKKMLGLD
jgi:hypothetical protein